MHIPNGLVSDPVCLLTTLASSTALGLGFRHAYRGDNPPSGQSLAAVGGLVFAAQMVNFPVDHGTSGHLIGGALATALLGPWGAMWAMTCVLATQAVLFGDGGCATLGANVLSMAVAAPWAAWLAYRGLANCGLMQRNGVAYGEDSGRQALCWGLAAMVSVLAAAATCSLVLACGGAAPAASVLPAMLLAHLPVGIAEAMATGAVVLLAAGRMPVVSSAGRSSSWHVPLALAVAVTVLLAPLASSAPDGLESVAERLGFLPSAADGFAGLMPDYAVPGIESAPLGVAMAGLVGVTAVAVAGYLVGRTATGPRKSR